MNVIESFQLKSRVAIVTGGSRGLGRQHAWRWPRPGPMSRSATCWKTKVSAPGASWKHGSAGVVRQGGCDSDGAD